MNKNTLGIFGLLVAIFAVTALLNDKFISAYNMQNLIKWSSLYAVMSIGVAFVIITGGIDLSIGSVVGLVACSPTSSRSRESTPLKRLSPRCACRS